MDGQAAVRMAAPTSYARVKVTGELPKDGPVVLRARYYSSGSNAFAAGIGVYCSPTELGAVRPKGWQTEELVFPASATGWREKSSLHPVLVYKSHHPGPKGR